MTRSAAFGKHPHTTGLVTTFNSSNADETNLEVHIEGLTMKLLDACLSVDKGLRKAGFHGKINSRITGTVCQNWVQAEGMESIKNTIKSVIEDMRKEGYNIEITLENVEGSSVVSI
jgi:hypothetical protein